MTRLADLVTTSQQVAGTSGRLAKVAALAALLRRLAPEEIEIAVAYLSGEMRQGKLGLGYAALRDARDGGEARGDPLALTEVRRSTRAAARDQRQGFGRPRARSSWAHCSPGRARTSATSSRG